MTIDETIKHEKWEEKYAHIDEDASEAIIAIRREYHKQIADWLEELKELREKKTIKHNYENCHNSTCRRKIYAEGIKDAIKSVWEKAIAKHDECLSLEELDEILDEVVKEGAEC